MPDARASERRRAVATPYFVIKAGEKKKGIRVVVGKAVDKRAVQRNFWKRQAKAALEEIVAPGRDVVVILSPKAKTLTKKQFKKILQDAAAQFGHLPA